MSKSIYFILGGALLGALGGYAYWYFIGCNTGSCPITSIWYHATGYGAIMGGLFGNIITPAKPEKETPESGKEER
ncbi:DUF6132 family protein [Balneolales bacterium ANBcel1]|nr:DUF6132 family protein [Balneolales bacterium ANBcel1]